MELEVELIIGRLSSLTDPCSNSVCKPKDKKIARQANKEDMKCKWAIRDQRTCRNEALHVIVGTRSGSRNFIDMESYDFSCCVNSITLVLQII